MSVDYSGLTRNVWPGTWSTGTGSPIVLDTEVRGTLQSISGNTGDQLTNIPGQRLQEGMVVYVKNAYTSGSTVRAGDRYYTYRLLAGESRSTVTGSCPNAEANWSEFRPSSSGLTVGHIDTAGTISNNISGITELRFDTDSGFDVTNLGGGVAKIAMNSTFKFIEVDGQDTLIAVGLDTLHLIPGQNIKIETNSTADPQSISISVDSTTLDAATLNGHPGSYYYSTSNKPTLVEEYTFSSALEWTVVHNKNTRKFIETVIDSEGNLVYAKLDIIDENSFKLKFTSAISGLVHVIF